MYGNVFNNIVTVVNKLRFTNKYQRKRRQLRELIFFNLVFPFFFPFQTELVRACTDYLSTAPPGTLPPVTGPPPGMPPLGLRPGQPGPGPQGNRGPPPRLEVRFPHISYDK